MRLYMCFASILHALLAFYMHFSAFQPHLVLAVKVPHRPVSIDVLEVLVQYRPHRWPEYAVVRALPGVHRVEGITHKVPARQRSGTSEVRHVRAQARQRPGTSEVRHVGGQAPLVFGR